VGYRRYWRDKDVVAELRIQKDRALLAKEQSEEPSPQRTHFANAVMHLNQAILEFEAGWRQEYKP
jgi:hypothetical protein